MLNNDIFLIGIQECSYCFLKELRLRLNNILYDIIGNDDINCTDRNIMIYNRNKIINLLEHTDYAIFSKRPGYGIQNAIFQYNNENIHLINTHIPGEPNNPGPNEFVNYLSKYINKDPLIVMCDMNISEVEMEMIIKKNNINLEVIAPYCTNIEPYTYKSKAIDQFLVSKSIDILNLDNIIDSLAYHVNIIN